MWPTAESAHGPRSSEVKRRVWAGQIRSTITAITILAALHTIRAKPQPIGESSTHTTVKASEFKTMKTTTTMVNRTPIHTMSEMSDKLQAALDQCKFNDVF